MHDFKFRREGDENCALLGYYVASGGNSLPTSRNNLSVPSSRVKNPKRMVNLARSLYKKHLGGDKFSVVRCQPIGLMRVGGGKAKCIRQCYIVARSFGNEKGKYKYEQSGRRKKESKIDNKNENKTRREKS